MVRNHAFSTFLHIATILILLRHAQSQIVEWSAVPSIRAGQIDSIVTLTTSADIQPSITDQTAAFLNDISGASVADLQVGLSLISYQSWMTDTFSYNISLVSVSTTNITVRFLVLDNTFFTRARVHYMVVWRINTLPGGAITKNYYIQSPEPTVPQVYNDIEVIYGCYLTSDLKNQTIRTQQIGSILDSQIKSNNKNKSDLVMKTMIAGMQLSNSVGLNNYVDVQAYFDGTKVGYTVTVENNNQLTQICLTTVIFDQYVNNRYMKTIIEYQTLSLNGTNTGLKAVPYSQRFDGMHRMFFGISRFNLSMSDTRYINVETSNVSLISQIYDKTSAMNEVVYNMIFFATRKCLNQSLFYDTSLYQCVDSCSFNSTEYPKPPPAISADYLFCNPCHYSCYNCSQGQDKTKCLSCNQLHNRTKQNGNECPCNITFIDVGVSKCALCNDVIGGCLQCSSLTVCTLCNNTKYQLNPTTKQCDCINSDYFVTGYCLNYTGCVVAQTFDNAVVCATCDASMNYIRYNNNLSCVCNQGYLKNISQPFNCYDECGDNITAAGHCDDGNRDPGDGCDEFCNVQNGFHCTTNYISPGIPGKSTCLLETPVSVTYLYAQRQVHTNQFTMAFKLNPIPPGLSAVSFNNTNFKTTLPVQNQKILYDPDTGTVFLTAEYLQDIESTAHQVQITFSNIANFYAKATIAAFTAIGINSQLIIDQNSSYNTILQYFVMGQGVIAILLAIFASVVGLKLAGIELLIPVQIIYFSLSTLSYMPSYLSTLTNLKYSNGYSSIVSYDYFRTYSQHSKLAAIQYETQFLLSTNFMIGIYVITLLWLLVHHLIIRYKQYKLQSFLSQLAIEEDLKPKKQGKENQSDSSQDKEDGEQDQQMVKLRRAPQNSQNVARENQLREEHHYSHKIFSFEVDRFYFIFYLILINQMLFGFNVMSLNLPVDVFYFPEELSVIICNFMLFLVMGNVVFIFYDQQSNKMINFASINDRYVYIYLILDAVIIILISFTFQQNISVYIVTALSSLYLFLIIIERPYSKNLLQFQNIVAIYLHIMLLTSQVLFCVVQSAKLTDQIKLIITCLIVGLILLGEILSVIRIILKVNFKKAFDDLKSPFVDKDDDQKVKKRVLQKNLDLLGKDNVEIIPPDSVRNGLFTPKDKMIDWQARNTEEYESLRHRDNFTGQISPDKDGKDNQQEDQHENLQKDEKLNELQILKKRLRNNLKQKRQSESVAITSKKTD